MSKKLFLIAGEASGDLHGAELVRALKKIIPDVRLRGLGGPLVQKEGVELLHDLTKESVLGLGDVLKKYFWFRDIFNQALREAKSFQPDAIILIDYPGFNLRFAKKINRRFPVFYYVSPQIWAWGGRRIHAIKRAVSHMIVFFRFEETIYRKASVPVTWVGHPLVDIVKATKSREELRGEWFPGLSGQEKVVALLPGSRPTEVDRILPEMLKAAYEIKKRIANVRFLISESPALTGPVYEKITNEARRLLSIQSVQNRGYDILRASDCALVSSGTATLEAALFSLPLIILYKTAWSTFLLGRILVQIPYIGLVNVLAGRKIVPEFIQHEICPHSIADEAALLLQNSDLHAKMIRELEEIRTQLGPSGASTRAAELIAQLISISRSMIPAG